MASRPHHGSGIRPTLADRVATARRDRFVGRTAELSAFTRAVHLPDPPFAVLFVHGPGGIGKSTLLAEYRRIAEDAGRRVITIDGHSCEPSPPGFLRAVAAELRLADPGSVTASLADQDGLVLLIDTYEALQPLDGWIRGDFLPHLPATAITVIAGRLPPDSHWRTSAGWTDLVEVQALRNLDPTESRVYLTRRNIPESAHEPVVAFTHGHPLALSLVGDVAARGDVTFEPDHDPDIITSLLEHFIEHVPSPLHRYALDVCAHARVTTEGLLAAAFGEPDAHALFDWLYGLSFIEHGPEGLFPHDLARDVLVANLRWRHHERFADVHRQVHDYTIARVRATHGREQFRELYSLMFLHRHNPTWRQFAQTDRYGHEYPEPATPADHPAIIDMIQHHEGPRSAEIADQWLRRQPEAFLLMHDTHADITGIVVPLMLDDRARHDIGFDPVMTGIMDMIDRNGPLQPGDEVACVRFCMGRDQYRSPATRTHFAMCTAPVAYTRTTMAWMVIPVVDPDYWLPVFDYLCIDRRPDLTVGNETWAIFGTDWRSRPIEELDQILTEREISLAPVLESPRPVTSPALMVLPEADFRQAVRQALRDYHRADAIAANPLCHSHLISAQNGADPVATLRDLLRSAADELAASAKTRRFHDAIEHTYLVPARTQEKAAEIMDVPFSTYRRYLATGIDSIAGELWRLELAASAAR